MTEIKANQNIYKIAMLVAVSCVLQISESMIPHLIPGLRLGLANVMTLIALVNLGFAPALEVAALRTILSSFIMGTFMSPAFILSFFAACASTMVMGLLYWLSSFHRHYRLSIVGISILSALFHNMAQLYLAYLILVRHAGIFVFLPWLCIGAVVMGWLTGVVAGSACLKLKEGSAPNLAIKGNPAGRSLLELRNYSSGDSYFHRLAADKKIIGIFAFSLLALIFTNLLFYLPLFLFLIAAAFICGAPLSFLFLKIKKSASLILASFLLPLFFNSGKHILLHTAYFKITTLGLNLGAVFAFRVIFLILASSLLIRVTSPKDLACGLSRVLFPLRFIGISQGRIAAILSLSWMAIPDFWQMARDAICAAELKRVKNLRNLIPVLSDIVAALYLGTEQASVVWKDVSVSSAMESADGVRNSLAVAGVVTAHCAVTTKVSD